MNLTYWLKFQLRRARVYPARYAAFMRTLYEARPRVLVEIGTNTGINARRMIESAAVFHPPGQIEYVGFDLFEHLTDEILAQELAIRPRTLQTVEDYLRATGARIRLVQGNTRETLGPGLASLPRVDFAFIDGGHSVETILSDWTHVEAHMQEHTVVMFDDYLLNREPEVDDMGCQSLIDSLPRDRFTVELLDPVDEFRKPWGVLKTRMVKVTRCRTG